MRKLFFLWFVFLWVNGPLMLNAQMVSREEAAIISQNYVRKVSDFYGGWSGSTEASPQALQEFRQGDLLIGYYCQVSPEGFIVMPLRRELGPVKASSEQGRFDPLAEEGIGSFLREEMAEEVLAIESKFSSIESAKVEDVESLCEFSYRQAWDEVYQYRAGSGKIFTPDPKNYAEGLIMTTTLWHQSAPYNNLCPPMGCPDTGNGRALVGCTATAMAQIMRFWAWPPHRNGSDHWYNWQGMKDVVTSSSPQAEQDAVAILSVNAADLAPTLYSCTNSIVADPLTSVPNALKNHFFFSSAVDTVSRKTATAYNWWIFIKAMLNLNRPILYLVNAHAIVCDGWREFAGPYEYHMNWGGGPNHPYTTWHTLDNLPQGGFYYERIIANIFPNTALSHSPTGTFPGGTIRYFDVDASSSGVIFQPGNWLQFGKRIKITGTGSTTGFFFNGTLSAPTLLYTDGVRNRGIVVKGGSMKVSNGGQVRLYP